MIRIMLRHVLLLVWLGLALGRPLCAQPQVAGRVFEALDRPLANAQIELVPLLSNHETGRLRLAGREPEPAAATRSDAHGRYALTAPRSGVWRIVVRADGRVPMQYGPLLLLEPEELPPLIPPADVSILLQIADDGGLPVAQAWVLAEPGTAVPRSSGAWWPDFRVGRTAADGSLTLPRLDAEPLAATVFAPGLPEQRRAEIAGGVWRLGRDVGVERLLRLTTPAGEALPDVLVRVGDAAWPRAVSDAGGSVRLRVPVGPSPPVVLVTRDGRQERLTLPPLPEAGGETRLVVGEDRRVSGQILDAATGKPPAGAFVRVDADPGRLVASDSAGRFELVAPGDHRFSLSVQGAGFLPRRVWVTAAQIRQGRVPTVSLDRASRLRGLVVGAKGEALPGVSVVAVAQAGLSSRPFASDDPVAERTESASSGSFDFRRLAPGITYELRAVRPGSFPAASRVTAPRPGSEGEAVRLQLLPTRPIHGVVVDAGRQPLSGVTLRLLPSRRPDFPAPAAEPEAAAGGASDVKGRFQLVDVPAAEVDLEAEKPGFTRLRLRGIRLSPGSGPLDLGTLVLQQGAALAGTVVDARGKPLSGAKIFVVESLPRRGTEEEVLRKLKPQASSGPDGRFQLRDQPAGVPLSLVVLAADHLPGPFRGIRSPSPEPLMLRLEPAWSLRGRVVSAEGEPVAGARLELRWQAVLPDDERQAVGPTILRDAASDRDGRFALDGMPGGTAWLGVTAHGFVPLDTLEVRVPAPDAGGEWVIVLQPGALLEGRVTTDAGDPVAGVRISAGGTAALSDADGRYQAEGVPLGEREVHVSHPNYRTRVQRKRIEPGANQLDVQLESGAEVAGRVVDEAGEPIAGAEVWMISRQQRDFPEYHARSAADGRFAFPTVAHGRYTLGAEAEQRSRTELEAAVVVTRENVSGLEVILRQGATLSGRILGLEPGELAVVQVRARMEDRGSFPARIDSQGRYEIRHLQPGDWEVRAALWDGQRQVEVRVPIGPSDREVSRDLEFRRRLTLTGQVLFDDEPLADTRVALRGERFAVERSATTDFEGRFRLDDLEADVYWLGLDHPTRWLVHNATVPLTGDRDLTIRLEASRVEGAVSDAASGQGVGDAVLQLHHPAGPEGPEFLFTGSTRADGTFSILRVPPGTYRLTVRAEGFSPAAQDLQVAAGQDLQGVDLRLQPAHGLQLEILRASGRAPALVHLQARGPQGEVVLAETHQPDAAGRMRLGTLPAGTWSLVISGAGGAAVTTTVTIPSEQPVAVTLPDAAPLRVRVPALVTSNLNASLVILGADQRPFWTLGPGGRPEQQWQLSGGTAVVDGVPAGAWTLQVKAPDGQSWVGQVTTSGLAEALVNLE
jgi:hypothetical protein